MIKAFKIAVIASLLLSGIYAAAQVVLPQTFHAGKQITLKPSVRIVVIKSPTTVSPKANILLDVKLPNTGKEIDTHINITGYIK